MKDQYFKHQVQSCYNCKYWNKNHITIREDESSQCDLTHAITGYMNHCDNYDGPQLQIHPNIILQRVIKNKDI